MTLNPNLSSVDDQIKCTTCLWYMHIALAAIHRKAHSLKLIYVYVHV